MNLFRTLTAVALTVAIPTTPALADDCAIAEGPLQVDFPRTSQEHRHHGVVEVAIRLGTDGRVVAVEVAKSSGHPMLDAAARKSAREYWRFVVHACSPVELAQPRAITVSFVKPPGLTVSGTLDRKSVARHRALAANESCERVRTATDTTVFSCRRSSSTRYASQLKGQGE